MHVPQIQPTDDKTPTSRSRDALSGPGGRRQGPGGSETSSPAARFQGQGTAGKGDKRMKHDVQQSFSGPKNQTEGRINSVQCRLRNPLSEPQTAIHPYVTGFLNLSADRLTVSLWRLNFPTLGSSV